MVKCAQMLLLLGAAGAWNVTLIHTAGVRSRILPVNKYGVSCALAQGPGQLQHVLRRRATTGAVHP